jgi:hypothetical protein
MNQISDHGRGRRFPRSIVYVNSGLRAGQFAERGGAPAHEAGAHHHEVICFGNELSRLAQARAKSDLMQIRTGEPLAETECDITLFVGTRKAPAIRPECPRN